MMPSLTYAGGLGTKRAIDRCIDYLEAVAEPQGRAKVFELGEVMREKPEISAMAYAILLMEQKTSHNYLMLFKPVQIESLRALGTKSIHLAPSELILIELSAWERRAFGAQCSEVGSVTVSAPQGKPVGETELGPIFPGTLLSIDDVPFVVVQCTAESNFHSGAATQRSSTHLMGELPGRPARGMVATGTHTLRVGHDQTYQLDQRTGVIVQNIGQATVAATLLLNAVDGPLLKLELIEVMSDTSPPRANAREITITNFRSLSAAPR